jgi:hypothetical protein
MIRAAVRAQREADRRYPVCVRIALPPEGLGGQLEIMHAWLDETCGTKVGLPLPPVRRAFSTTPMRFISRTLPLPMPLSPVSAAAIAARP